SDMLDNYTGIYKGIFSSADNNKILTELDLRADYSYTLRQEYLTDNGRVFESSGKWYPSVDISSFVLNKNKDLIFYFINKNTIEKLGNNGERLESGNYILKK
ncbi:MAG: copper resistance protein NlpE, partial [Endomicrobium sp.]|nr:copper resistance protein NlpE [Endomicrobium sp.]